VSGATFKVGVVVAEPLAGALKLKADVPVAGEAEGALKLNAELPVAGDVGGLLEAPKVISEAERLRELERSGCAVNELISDTCRLIVGAPAGELKLNALFVVGEEAEAEGSPNTKG